VEQDCFVSGVLAGLAMGAMAFDAFFGHMHGSSQRVSGRLVIDALSKFYDTSEEPQRALLV
jgi:hypothetical protein